MEYLDLNLRQINVPGFNEVCDREFENWMNKLLKSDISVSIYKNIGVYLYIPEMVFLTCMYRKPPKNSSACLSLWVIFQKL